jgi:hypothetical protein
MTNRGCSSAAKRRTHPVVRLRLAFWILRFAQNDRKNLSWRTSDKSGHGFMEYAPGAPGAAGNEAAVAKRAGLCHELPAHEAHASPASWREVDLGFATRRSRFVVAISTDAPRTRPGENRRRMKRAARFMQRKRFRFRPTHAERKVVPLPCLRRGSATPPYRGRSVSYPHPPLDRARIWSSFTPP